MLSEAGVEEASLDARYLLFEAFDMDLTHFIWIGSARFLKDELILNRIDQYRSMIDKRSQRIPLQQITGSREFMGLGVFCQ